MMKIYRIEAHKKGDGLFRRSLYIGETDGLEEADYGGTVGFHNANHNIRDKIEFVDMLDFVKAQKALKIEGRRNLLSHLKRIVDREPDGILDGFDELIITIKEEE
jgi:hypothetical protein